VVDGSYLSEYDAHTIAEIISKHGDEEQVEIKFSDEKAYKDAIKRLKANENVHEIMQALKNRDDLIYWMFDDWHMIKIILAPDK
jgi:hypothetical protein